MRLSLRIKSSTFAEAYEIANILKATRNEVKVAGAETASKAVHKLEYAIAIQATEPAFSASR